MAINLDTPLYDQETYAGRAMHFFRLTNPLNILASDAELDEAKRVVNEYRSTKKLPKGYDVEKLWSMKYLYDSAFHPDTGEKTLLIGRMSAQAPMNTIITGGMITFYKSSAAVIFWQWLNQTFNAVVNYSNRSGTTPISKEQLALSYVSACSGAVGTAMFLNGIVKNNPKINPVFARLVPFAAVCGANFINIPMMRNSEIRNGMPVYTESGVHLGNSTFAAVYSITLVCFSRVLMAVPGMTLAPIITNHMVARGTFCHRPMMAIPFQMALLSVCITFATPLCCAIFKQKASLPVSALEADLKARITKTQPKVTEVHFNKGL